MIIESHLWETADGRLVETGHPDAAVLAYPAGTEISDEEAEKRGLKKADKPADKQAAKSQDKQAEPPANKAAKRPARKSE